MRQESVWKSLRSKVLGQLEPRTRQGRILLALLPGVLVVAGAGVLAFKRSPAEVPRNPNVLLITVDTLRADGLGAYTGKQGHTPTIDALAQRGVLFERVFAQAPATGPSFSSIMTGQYPVEHTVVHSTKVLPPTANTMAEYFQERGYETGAFVSCSILAGRYGFSQGFDVYDDRPERPYEGGEYERDGASTVDAAQGWLSASDRSRPFFAWVHLFDAHAPYIAHGRSDLDARLGQFEALDALENDPEARAKALPTVRALYDGEVHYVDTQVARLMSMLRAQDLAENTVVVVAADHGEELFDHDGLYGHFTQTTQSVLHVPLIIAGPGVPRGQRVTEWVENVDILPTLHGLVKAEVEPGLPQVSGHDLTQLFGGGAPATRISRAQREPYEWMPGGMAFAAVRDRWKLRWMEEDGGKLYDLSVDPLELHDVGAEHPQVKDELMQSVLPWRKRNEELGFKSKYALPPQDVLVLKALGYVR